MSKQGLKGAETRDLDLQNDNDWYGFTYSGGWSWDETVAAVSGICFNGPFEEHMRSIKTWVSLEPVLNADDVIALLHEHEMLKAEENAYIDRWKIGKLNYHPSDIDWKAFGREVERICVEAGVDYYINAD